MKIAILDWPDGWRPAYTPENRALIERVADDKKLFFNVRPCVIMELNALLDAARAEGADRRRR